MTASGVATSILFGIISAPQLVLIIDVFDDSTDNSFVKLSFAKKTFFVKFSFFFDSPKQLRRLSPPSGK